MTTEYEKSCISLASKKRLLLTVEVSTPEDADQILRWMYAKEKPMPSNLVEIAWDKVAVNANVASAIDVLEQALGS